MRHDALAGAGRPRGQECPQPDVTISFQPSVISFQRDPTMATSKKPMNAFYAQSGGVTAVINASAAGVIETARKHKNKIGTVYAGRTGTRGGLTEDLIDTGKESAK